MYAALSLGRMLHLPVFHNRELCYRVGQTCGK